MLIILIILVIFLFVILLKSAEGMVGSVKKLSAATGVGDFTLAAVLVSLTTSLPELFVGVTSAFSGESALSLGNVIGANILNVSLVISLAGIFGGTVYLREKAVPNREFLVALLAGLMPFLLLWDRNLSRMDGLILVVLYILYTAGAFHGKTVDNFWKVLIEWAKADGKHSRRDIVKFLFFSLLLLVCSYFIVTLAKQIAILLGIDIFIIGLLLIAIGTTMPEIALSIRSVKDHDPRLAIGNRLGSVIANGTLILGVVALLGPFKIAARREYLFSVASFIILFFLFWSFLRTKHSLSRWEAAVLFGVYIIFILFTLL
ncbi:MAG: sodium:calcium antiporter [Candidatus Blackburnbacteria bacterium]|nr:sodium:calcium antiporter [Candidatus Blackburnbacteria bacterium]